MKVLVTGATGGIGSLIIEELIRSGAEVIATSRDAEKAKQLPFYDKVTYIPYDFSKPLSGDLFEYFHKPDSLIHPAWDKLSDFKSSEHLDVFLKQHQHFVGSLISHGLKDFNGIGTCYECGLHEGLLDEACTSPPTLPYAEAKNLLRIYAEALCLKHNASYKWIRMFYVFGEVKGRKNLYTLLMQALQNGEQSFNMSGGEQVRDFLTPIQYAQKIVKIALQKEAQGIVNCCSGRAVKLRDFVNEFLSQHHYTINLNLGFYPYPDYEPMQTWGAVEKLDKILKN